MAGDASTTVDDQHSLSSGPGRWVIVVTVAGSAMAFLDSTVVNVALPEIGRDLGATTGVLQWVLTGYLLALASLILVGGSLGDRFGRRRVYLWGAVVFALGSVLCSIAPNGELLVGARVLQGVGAALLTPGSLAIIQASIVPGERGRAIGMWSGLTGVASAVGPLVGGYLVGAVSWRAIFWLNVPIGVFVVVMGRVHVPESHDPEASGRVDVVGAALAALGLGLVTFALITTAGGAVAPVCGAAGAVALVAFLAVEARVAHPMLPLGLFRSRQFSASNGITFLVYAAIGAFFFLLASFLQIALGYSPLEAGAAALPVTILMLLLSPRSGALVERVGPRLPLTLGPFVIAVGLALLALVNPGDAYLTHVLPAVTVIAVGLVILVAPITTTVLAAAGDAHAGIGSGINNAVARVGSLLAVAILPAVVGLTGDDFYVPSAMTSGFHQAMLISAAVAFGGGVVGAALISNPAPTAPALTAPHPTFSCSVACPTFCEERVVGQSAA